MTNHVRQCSHSDDEKVSHNIDSRKSVKAKSLFNKNMPNSQANTPLCGLTKDSPTNSSINQRN